MRLIRTTCLHALGLGLALTLCFATQPRAHPHAWIQLESKAVFGADHQVSAIELEWLFDEFYTLYLQDALPEDPEERQKALMLLAETNLKNLGEYNYFAEVKADGEEIGFAGVTEYDTELRDGRLWMRFTLPLEKTIDPRRQDLTYASYDPTYYIEILHSGRDGAGVTGPGSEGCKGFIVSPNPSLDMIADAAALGPDEEAPPTLGRLFAERVVVKCP